MFSTLDGVLQINECDGGAFLNLRGVMRHNYSAGGVIDLLRYKQRFQF